MIKLIKSDNLFLKRQEKTYNDRLFIYKIVPLQLTPDIMEKPATITPFKPTFYLDPRNPTDDTEIQLRKEIRNYDMVLPFGDNSSKPRRAPLDSSWINKRV